MKTQLPHSLTHQLLIAMPQLDDPNFSQTVVYVIDHSADGAMGLVINRTSGLSLSDVIEQVRPEHPAHALSHDIPVLAGGPVERERGFVLHPRSEQFDDSSEGNLGVDTSLNSLYAIADNQGPDRFLIALGYSGWSAGQLEAELADNVWLTIPADNELMFDLPYDQRWLAAGQRLGINLNLLSRQTGRA